MCNAWEEIEVETLIRMREEGASVAEIADELGRSCSSVKMYLQRHRDELGLKSKRDERKRPSAGRPEFDKAWYGVVPLGHWSITKPWSKSCVVKPVTKF